MLVNPDKPKETWTTRVLKHARDFGIGNPKGQVFERIFNREDRLREVTAAENTVGEGLTQMTYPNGNAADGFSTYTPAYNFSDERFDPQQFQNAVAENQINLFWRKNVERALKYDVVAKRAEVNESLIQICNEGVYEDENQELCSLQIDPDLKIGDPVKDELCRIFRQEVLRRIMNFRRSGWEQMRYLLVRGRLFFEVIYDEQSRKIVGLNMLPEENMVIIYQNNLIIGFRQMLSGAQYQQTGGKNYIDYSPNQILYASLGLYGPGGINDTRSILEMAMKPYNQLNTIEDSVVMYRVLWGSEKLMMKIDTSGMNRMQAEKFMKDQAKQFSRHLDYNPMTGEVTNFGRVVGLTEHYLVSLAKGRTGSTIERMAGGEQLGNIDDLKFFKRNLVNSMMVPPGRITALAGDSNNYSNGKIGEVTQAEVAFAKLVQRYQIPFEDIMIRLFVMVLDTHKEFNEDIKLRENFSVKFKRSNGFENFIHADVWASRLETFAKMMEQSSTKDNPDGAISKRFALTYGLCLNDEEYARNKKWLKQEKAEAAGESTGEEENEAGAAGGGAASPIPGGLG